MTQHLYLIVALISSFTNNLIQLFDKPFVGQSTYKSVKIGSSNLYIKTPFELVPSNVTFPESVKQNLAKYEIFSFEKDNTFKGKISYLVWKDGIDYSVVKGVDGAIANVKRLPGIERIDEKRHYFTKGKIDGCLFKARVFRYGKSFIMKGANLNLGRENWSVLITLLDSKDENMADIILNSLK